MKRFCLPFATAVVAAVASQIGWAFTPVVPLVPANFVITNANVVTVDARFTRAEALAVRSDRILAVGDTKHVALFIGPQTRVIDANGRTILPGLIDSHVHAYRAAVTELDGVMPTFKSLAEALQHIHELAVRKPPGSWIVLQRVYPTRLKEGRLPTKTELDAAAPNHAVYWNAGPVSMANSKALEISSITRETPNPPPGEVVKNPKTGEPTGLLREAAQLLKFNVAVHKPTAEEQRRAMQHLYRLYNQQGITSIGERRGDPEVIDLCRELSAAGELTLRVNLTRIMQPVPRTLDEAVRLLVAFTNAPAGKPPCGPTGVGDDWVRIGPFKLWLDGGMLIGTAFMREPWGVGETYQITDPDYRGILNVPTNIVNGLMLEAARRGWQLTAHCAGEAAADVLLDAYERVQKEVDIRQRRCHLTHANFMSAQNLERCRRLGVAGDIHFLLGQMYDKKNDIERAYAHFMAGN